MYYVLMQSDDRGSYTPLGVFSSPKISDEKLYEYFGVFHTIGEVDVRDSGVEWQKTIAVDDYTVELVMFYFDLNEIP